MKNKKKCPSCLIVKDISNFGIRYKNVYRSYCRECEIIRKRNYDFKNREEIRKRARLHYQKNAEKEKERAVQYRKKNKKKLAVWYQNNKSRILKRQLDRSLVDPRFRLRRSISACIRERLYSRKISKNYKKTFSFVPYTIEDLVSHLEALFQPGMTWDNYGKWHIDHIIPDSSFKYQTTDDEEFKKCWSLSNLQPLWARDNLIKSNKIL